MTKYKRTDQANGVAAFFVDGKRRKAETIDEGIRKRLENGMEVEITSNNPVPTPPPATSDPEEPVEPEEPSDLVEAPDRICFIDGEVASHPKFLQGKMVWLCDTHYSLTSGKVVQQMREKKVIA